MALAELEIQPKDLVVCSGIGQAPKSPQYMNTNYFNGLHGGGLFVPAVCWRPVNPNLTVIVEGVYIIARGGNHFIHNIRREP